MSEPTDEGLDLTPRSVAVVGNAPDMDAAAEAIDAADWVVRFNNAPGFGGRAGSRVTHLALVNHGGQMREWLEDADFTTRPVLRGAREVLFPFPRKDEPARPGDEDGRDWTAEAQAILQPLGLRTTILPEAVHAQAAEILAMSGMAQPAPSTGLLVGLYLLGELPMETRIDVYGFGFAGWDGHAWNAECNWFEAMAAQGRLRLHPLRPRAAA
ncbi:hypothetical protein [Aureimonas psammosilenae]|uniref:hypothetical protein n=1 Tax=Aureimonas psammosilenae TaxID=2495496 RepID=UPI00126082FC|nr:hypothetical protein [Aureimonas psammosilenae]